MFTSTKRPSLKKCLPVPGLKSASLPAPRRFGKTLTMSMLHAFFDISCNSRQLFEGLAISRNTELCEKWMNQYPTVFITFKEIYGKDYKDAQAQMAACIRDLLIEYSYLLESEKVDSSDREKLALLKKESGTWTDLTRSLSTLCRALKSHWGKPVILLIDE